METPRRGKLGLFGLHVAAGTTGAANTSCILVMWSLFYRRKAVSTCGNHHRDTGQFSPRQQRPKPCWANVDSMLVARPLVSWYAFKNEWYHEAYYVTRPWYRSDDIDYLSAAQGKKCVNTHAPRLSCIFSVRKGFHILGVLIPSTQKKISRRVKRQLDELFHGPCIAYQELHSDDSALRSPVKFRKTF